MEVKTEKFQNLNVALITANVGSIFEKPEQLLAGWISSFVESVLDGTDGKPQFVALHCQEIGGKSFGTSMSHVDLFFRQLAEKFNEHSFTIHLAFVDKSSANDIQKFTALANVYFIHESVLEETMIWNFKTESFEKLAKSYIHDDKELDLVATVHKHKFGAEMTPMHRPSRKGFLRTRWSIGGQNSFELINVHLFHDESNFVAMKKFPSMYTEGRRKALDFTLQSVGCNSRDVQHKDKGSCKKQMAFFIFGDFNFRLDVGAVVSWLSEGAELHETKDNAGELTKQVFFEKSQLTVAAEERSDEDRKVLTLERKLFQIHKDKCRNILQCDLTRKKLLSHDKEIEYFNEDLMEEAIIFPPSYPYSEDVSSSTSFSGTRCPSWCDRVFYNKVAEELFSQTLQYDIIGKDTCMGDHKPVILRIVFGKGVGVNLSSQQTASAHQKINGE